MAIVDSPPHRLNRQFGSSATRTRSGKRGDSSPTISSQSFPVQMNGEASSSSCTTMPSDINASVVSPKGTKSPIRKAMSLSTMFRSSTDGRTSAASSTSSSSTNGVPQGNEISSASPGLLFPPPSPSLLPAHEPHFAPTTVSASGTLRRCRRRLSLGFRSPSPSPVISNISSPTSTASPLTPGASSYSSTSPGNGSGSTTWGASASRPRSGSCRAALRYGGRTLPFTLPSVGDGESEDQVAKRSKPSQQEPASKVFHMDRAPKRPSTPAPLLDLPKEFNSLGITTAPMAEPPASDRRGPLHDLSQSAATPRQRSQTGLGLSSSVGMSDSDAGAPLHRASVDSSSSASSPPSSATPTNLAARRRLHFGGHLSGHRHSRRASQESFHCRGLSTPAESQSSSDSGLRLEQASLRASGKCANSAGSASPDSVDKQVVPTSPLWMRPRPWPLTEQMQKHSTNAVKGSVPPRKSSIRAYLQGQHGPDGMRSQPSTPGICLEVAPAEVGETALAMSRFSSESDLNSHEGLSSTTRNGVVAPDARELSVTSYSSGHSALNSPASTWSSSASSYEVAQGTVLTDALLLSHQYMLGSHEENEAEDVLTRADLPTICPRSPPRCVRLQLTMPPTSIAKYPGLGAEQILYMPMTASSLEFKEAICAELLQKHGLSISPSQVGLFVAENVHANAIVMPTSPTTPQAAHRLLLGSPKFGSWGSATSALRGYGETCTATRGSLEAFRPRRSLSTLRQYSSYMRRPSSAQQPSSTGAAQNIPLPSTCPDATPLTAVEMAPTSSSSSGGSTLAPVATILSSPTRFESMRMLQNDTPLFQEGLQDDDEIIVRF